MRGATRSLSATVLTSALLVLGACGGDDDALDETGSDSTDAVVDVAEPPVAADETATDETVADDETSSSDSGCGLTDEQVSSVMGIDMVPIEGTCGWQAPGLEGAVVEVYLSGSDATMLAAAEGDEVAGVGDEARFDFIDVLNFRIGESFYYVQVLNMGGASAISSPEASIAVAKLWVEALT